MTDVFISYAHADLERVEKLAHALEAAGISVWWDRRIDLGAEFSKDIERELAGAKAVIVAWSAASADSPWVRDEASFARKRGTLIPITLDANEPPLGFRQFHAFDFSRWRGDPKAEDFQTLRAAITRRIAGEAAPLTPPFVGAAPKSLIARVRKHPVPVAAGVLATIAVVVAIVFLADDRQPTARATDEEAGSAAMEATAIAQGVGLAVIPFTNVSSDPEQEHFADGLTEELLNWLGNVEGLKVPGRASSFQFKGKAEDLRAIGEALSVDYLLEGSVRRSGDALRISAQLIEAKSGYRLWSETYDRELADLFAIQDEIARLVVTELLGKIPESGAANPAAVGDVDPRSHQLYLEGRSLLTRRQWAPAFDKFRAAIAIDPRHPLAQAYFAVVAANAIAADYALSGFDEDLPAAMTKALGEAVRLKPHAADVLFAQGWVADSQSGAPLGGPLTSPAVIDLYRRTVRANPRHVEALHALARVEASPQTQIELFERILEIDPAHASARTNLTTAYLQNGDRAKAVLLARQTLSVVPDAPLHYVAISGKNAGDAALVAEALFADWEATDRHLHERMIRASHLATLGAVDEARFLFARDATSAERPWAQLNRINVAILDRDPAAALAAARDMHETEQPPGFSTWALVLALISADEPELAYATLAEARPKLNDPTQAESIRDRVQTEEGEFGDPEIVTAAHALDLAGRHDEARGLWEAALEVAEREPPRTWLDYLNLSLLHGRIGNRAAAVREFKAAYDAGFRYLWSYDCDGCVHDGFYAENGLFVGLVEIPEIAALVDRIEAENAQTLEALNKQYGVLDKVRAMMAAEPEK